MFMKRFWDRIVWLFGARPPQVWVYDPANDTDHDSGRITPPGWAENVGGKWASRPRRRRHITVMVIILVLLAAVLTGVGVWQHGRVEAGLASCQETEATVRADLEELHAAASSDRVTDALAISVDEVLDASTVDALSAAVNQAGQNISLPSCEVGFFDPHPDQAPTIFDEPAALLAEQSDALDGAVDAVLASRDKKLLADAKTALQDVVDKATDLLDSSKGNVEDDTTRTTLNDAIKAAQTLLDDSTITDPDAYADVRATVKDAVSKVNDSVKAKQEADKEAAERAAAEAAAAAAAAGSSSSSGSGSYNGGGWGSSGSSFGSGSSGGGSSSSGTSSSGSGSRLDKLPGVVGGIPNPSQGESHGEPNI